MSKIIFSLSMITILNIECWDTHCETINTNCEQHTTFFGKKDYEIVEFQKV